MRGFELTLKLALGLCLMWAMRANAETLGSFRFYDIFLAPRLHLQELGESNFELKQSWLGVEWEKSESLRGVLKWGTGDLLKPAVWYPNTNRDFEIVEAWIENRSEAADVRVGLLEIPMGFEGAHPTWNSVFPQSLVQKNRWFVQRDLGLQFRWSANPWSTTLSVHNGESGANTDRWMWYSGLWQYLNDQGVGVLLTASLGHTRVDSTSASVANSEHGFNFNSLESAKHRVASFTVFREFQRSLFLLEIGRGDVIQLDQKFGYGWARFDLSAPIFKDINCLARYEETHSDLNNPLTKKISAGLGLVFSSRDNLQSMTLFAAQNKSNPEVPDDEFWMLFRLHSQLLQ